MKKTLLLLLVMLTASAQAITLSGKVANVLGAGMASVSMRLVGQITIRSLTIPFDTTVTTNASGNYLLDFGTLPSGGSWSGVLTPRRTGYAFSPANKSFSAITTNQVQNFTGAASTVTISGYVRNAAGTGLSGVTVSFSNSGGTATTSSTGSYSRSVGSGWSGTATPSHAAYTFSPASLSYTSVSASQTNQNFTATLRTYIISGRVMNGQFGMNGVTITLSNGGGSVGTSGDIHTAGSYAIAVNYGWSGTATPSLSGRYFSPESRSYSNVTADQADQGYDICLRLAGTVRTSTGIGMSGVAMILNGTGHSGVFTFAFADTVYTDAAGVYLFPALPIQYDATLTPVAAGRTLSPLTRTYSGQAVSLTGQDFSYSPVLSGKVTLPGDALGVSGLLAVFPGVGTVTTNGAGFTQVVPYGWSGTVIIANPYDNTGAGRVSVFNPGYILVSAAAYDRNDLNFTITLPSITLAGRAILEAGDTAHVYPLPGVRVGFTLGDTAITDSNGWYRIVRQFTSIDKYWGIARPVHNQYTFTPDKWTYNATGSDSSVVFRATPKDRYRISAAAGAHGRIAPAGDTLVFARSNIRYAVTPDPGHAIGQLTVDGVSLGGATAYQFTELADSHTISASFTPLTTQYTITSALVLPGYEAPPARVCVTPAGAVSVNQGNSCAFLFTGDPFIYGPNALTIKDILVDGFSVDSLALYRRAYPAYEYLYTFNDVQADHSIVGLVGTLGSGTTLYISATALPGGTIVPSGQVHVVQGGSLTLEVRSDSLHRVLNVSVDGINRGALAEYTFSNVQTKHVITAAFAVPTTTIQPTKRHVAGPPVSLTCTPSPIMGNAQKVTVELQVTRTTRGSLLVQGVDGRTVTMLAIDQLFISGTHEFVWQPPANPGVYCLTFINDAGRQQQVRVLVVR
jgi:hypothetical protein